jgi:hypothetical protein
MFMRPMMWEVNSAAPATYDYRHSAVTKRRAENRESPRRPLVAELAPAYVAGGRVELQLRLTSHFGASTRARWAVEVVDDRDVPVGASLLEGPVVLGGLGGTHTATLSLPPQTADGFYVLRVTAVARAEERSDAAVLERYVEVREGGIVAVDADDHDTQPYTRILG